MSFTSSAALPYTLGGVIVAAAIGGGASGVLTNGVAAALSMSGLLWLLDAHVGTITLSYLGIRATKERRDAAQRMYFSPPSAWRRYLVEGLGSPLLFAATALTGVGYVTMAVLIGCASACGTYLVVTLFRTWKQAGSLAGNNSS